MTQGVLCKLADNLIRLSQQLAALGDDLKFGKAGGRVFYAVDFSEVHSFLDPAAELPEHLTVGLFVGDRESTTRQHRLGLTHLFQSVTDTVYLLPPHAHEMWSYVRHWSDEAEQDQTLLRRAQDMVSSLTPEHQALLQGLAQHGGVPDKHEFKQLIELVKGEFEALCLKVSDLTTRPPAYHRLARLKDLVKQGHLSYRIEEMFERLGVSLPSKAFAPKEEVVGRVFELFPQHSRDERPLNKRLDARALLYLDEINQVLVKHKTKLLFITRDQGIVSVADRLEDDPDGPRVRSYLRSVDAILFDLMLRGVSDEKVRLGTIQETDDLLANLERSVSTLLDGLKTPEDSRLTKELTEQGKRLIEQAQILWDDHVNLRLSQAMPALPWLREALQSSVKPTGSQTLDKEVNLLRTLWGVVARPEYQQMAECSVTELMTELLDNAMRSLFVGILSSKSLDAVMDVFAQPRKTKKKTALRSRRYTVYVSLHFSSPEYQPLLAELSGEPEPHTRYEKAKRAFIRVIQKVITERPSEAEGFLFMAFVLGLLDFWEEADNLADRSAKLADKMPQVATEAYYLRTVLNRKMALIGKNDALDRLKCAFESIMRAIGKDQWKDPRFLKELATIILQYHYFSKIQGRTIQKKLVVGVKTAKQPSDLKLQQAIEILLEALELTQDDRRLRVEILNNLAYVAVHNEEELPLDRAESYIVQMMQEFKKGRSDQPPQLPPEPWAALEDTRVMVTARRFQHNRNRQGLEECIANLGQILNGEDLSQAEQMIIERHLSYVQQWIKELDVSDTVSDQGV